MIYRLTVTDDLEEEQIYSERVFSPAQVEEALGRMQNNRFYMEEREKELKRFTKSPF